jgi:hypothetical protein
VDARNNFWGASTGPGADPADVVCLAGGSVVASPFLTRPVAVTPIDPRL